MENNYKKLMRNIHTPEELEDRVLCTSRRQAMKERRPKRVAKPNWQPALRGTVCAACALALVLGTVHLRPTEESGEQTQGMPAMTLNYSFGLTAYAAETGETVAPNANGGLAFLCGEGLADPEEGDFTGCLFQVTGDNIKTVALSIDRGGLYRYRLHTDLTDQEMADYRKAMEEGTIVTAAISQTEDGVWYVPEMTTLGTSVTEDHDPEMNYGFWVPPEEMIVASEMDLREETSTNIDVFDGARLTVTVTFADGREQSKTYTLSTGRLRSEYDQYGMRTVLPQLAGDNEACVYGVYAVSEAESTWFQWPVQDSNTVSLSNRYGYRTDPGGETRTFHAGIDIPAEQGTAITAAAAGTVIKAEFDADKGNYIVLDHGNGMETVYAQCLSLAVEAGDTVEAGQAIAAVGSTGKSTGPHLCFQVWQDGEAQNPVAYFDAEIRDTLRMG